MPTADDRRAAIDQMLGTNGSGSIVNRDEYRTNITNPALSAPDTARTGQVDAMWADRNRIIADAAKQMLGGYGSALNAARQQTEEAWLADYLKSKQGRGGTRRGGGGGGGGDSTPTALTPPPMTDPWAWIDDWIARTTPAPAPRPSGPASTTSTLPRPTPALPTVKRY